MKSVSGFTNLHPIPEPLVGRKLQCCHCRNILELEQGDQMHVAKLHTKAVFHKALFAQFQCPRCSSVITLPESLGALRQGAENAQRSREITMSTVIA